MIMKMAAAWLAASMMAFDTHIPSVGGHARAITRAVRDKDGLGRRVLPKSHPKHNAKRETRAFRDFRDRVEATHSNRPDPRDDKYLHSHARQMRHLKRMLTAA